MAPDLETSGLDPRKDQILEVAACVADLESPFDGHTFYQAVLKMPHLGDVHPVVQEMHMKNGLWNECAKSIETIEEVEEVLIEMSGRTPASDRDNQTTLAGSCVSFDLAFLQRWMPTLAKYLHYRVYDVSSIMLFCRSLGMPRLPKAEAHRAMADVRESMTNAKACVEWLGPRWPVVALQPTSV